ncbi:hypothetical protein VTH06DRAFT_3611 [Thermothelomyces fergusii]
MGKRENGQTEKAEAGSGARLESNPDHLFAESVQGDETTTRMIRQSGNREGIGGKEEEEEEEDCQFRPEPAEVEQVEKERQMEELRDETDSENQILAGLQGRQRTERTEDSVN